MFTVGQKCWTPDSETMGQGVITEIGSDNDVKVTHIDNHGRQNERWFSNSVVQLVPTAGQLEVQASNTFRARHLKDFNPCQSNVQMMTDHIRANRWPWTAEHLERAFVALKSKLAPVAVPVQTATPAPATSATAVPAAPAAPVTPTPSAPIFTLTKRQVAAASKDQMRSWMNDEPKGAVAALEALGIRTKLPVRWRQ